MKVPFSWLKEFVPYIIILIVVILIKQFLVTPVMVEGTSMDTTLKDGDVMILNRIRENLLH